MKRDNDPDETRGRELYRALANGQEAFDMRTIRKVTKLAPPSAETSSTESPPGMGEGK